MQYVRAAMITNRQQAERQLRYVAAPLRRYALTRRWRGTRAHNATSATRKAIMRGCKIHTPYRSEIAPVMLMSSGEAFRADLQRIRSGPEGKHSTHKGIMALPA
jgi:hypothetical protein